MPQWFRCIIIWRQYGVKSDVVRCAGVCLRLIIIEGWIGFSKNGLLSDSDIMDGFPRPIYFVVVAEQMFTFI